MAAEKYGAIAVLSPLVTRILGQNPGKFTLEGTNTYLIGAGRKRLLLDTGDGNLEYKQLLQQYIQATGLEIDKILVTHWHYDHLAGLPDVVDLFPKAKVFKGRYLGENEFAGIPLNEIKDGDKFQVATQGEGQDNEDEEEVTLTAYSTPGHADDHFVFWLSKENALFSGDNVLGTGTSVFSDLAQYMSSLGRMLAVGESQGSILAGQGYSSADKSRESPTATSSTSTYVSTEHSSNQNQQEAKPDTNTLAFRIYPGHGPLIQDGASKIKEYMTHRQRREDEIIALLHESSTRLTAKDITKLLYQAYPESVLTAAENGVRLHLKKLVEENRVEQLNEQYSSRL